jgi:hypothetical protein
MNRMMSPETIGTGMEVEYDHVGFSTGTLSFENADTNNPLLMSTVTERSLHVGLGLVERMDVFIEVPKESSSRVGGKIMLLGEPEKKRANGHKLALVLAMGTSTDTYELEYEINMTSSLQDYGIIHGYRFNENFLIYEGLSVTSYDFEGDIVNGTGLNSSTIQYAARNILGGNLGMVIGPPSLKIKAEVAVQRITWTNTDTKLFYSMGYALTATW